MRVDCDSLTMYPTTDGMGTHGGYCGEAVKPIALNMVAEIARTADTRDIPLSGIGVIGMSQGGWIAPLVADPDSLDPRPLAGVPGGDAEPRRGQRPRPGRWPAVRYPAVPR